MQPKKVAYDSETPTKNWNHSWKNSFVTYNAQ